MSTGRPQPVSRELTDQRQKGVRMRVVVLELKRPEKKLVMTLDGKKIELKKAPDDPAVKTECGEALCSVVPWPERGTISFVSNDQHVQKGHMFDPKERDSQFCNHSPGSVPVGEERKRSPRENLLEASLNANCGQIDALAEFICREFPDEPGKFGSESAVECAIRVMEQLKAKRKKCCRRDD